MTTAIRYYTQTGNTKKLADAIAETAGVKAEDVSVPLEGYTDILFLGSSVYAAGIDPKVKEFIRTLKPENVGKVVCFSTAALLPSTYRQVSGLLKKQGVAVSEKEFHCRGRFLQVHKDHPDAQDIEAVRQFAAGVLK